MFVDLVVEEVFVPGYRGELNILPGHTPLVTVLDTGVLKFKNSSTNETVVAAISWGYCEVRNDNVNILAETAELPRDIDFHRAKDALKLSEEVLCCLPLFWGRQRFPFNSSQNRNVYI